MEEGLAYCGDDRYRSRKQSGRADEITSPAQSSRMRCEVERAKNIRFP